MAAASKPTQSRLSRRRFLKIAGASVVVGAGALGGYVWRIEPHWIEIVRCPLPIVGLPVKNKRYARGRVDLPDGRTLYVNRGLGYLRRWRFNVRPEITVFTLTRADA